MHGKDDRFVVDCRGESLISLPADHGRHDLGNNNDRNAARSVARSVDFSLIAMERSHVRHFDISLDHGTQIVDRGTVICSANI